MLLAENEENMQTMLNYVFNWCKRWRLVVNDSKSKVMHFRKVRRKRSVYKFYFGDQEIEQVQEYKYLGIILNEHLNYNRTIETLTKSAGRALGGLISKFRYLKNLGFKTYSTMYKTCVEPVLNYGSEIWGYKEYTNCETLQIRAMKYYLGVHKYAPNVAVRGDCGWLKTKFVQWINMCRFWNRLMNMDQNKITYKMFMYDYEKCKNNWCSEMKEIFTEMNMLPVYSNQEICNIEDVCKILEILNKDLWAREVKTYPKLRTYITFKDQCKEEKYLSVDLSRRERSLYAQLRCGILPLRLELGRYKGEKEEQRICILCTENRIENETHFVLHCNLYKTERDVLFQKICEIDSNFNLYDDTKKMHILNNTFFKWTCKFIVKAFEKRKNTMYK